MNHHVSEVLTHERVQRLHVEAAAARLTAAGRRARRSRRVRKNGRSDTPRAACSR